MNYELSNFESKMDDKLSNLETNMDTSFWDELADWVQFLDDKVSNLKTDMLTDMLNIKSDLNDQMCIWESDIHITIPDLKSEINDEFMLVRSDLAQIRSAINFVENVISENESRTEAMSQNWLHWWLSWKYKSLCWNKGHACGPAGFDMGSTKCEMECNSNFEAKYVTE